MIVMTDYFLRHRVLFVALAAVCGVTRASSPDVALPEAYLQSLPSASIETSAQGDLNGDGRDDWVLSVSTADGNRRLLVLLQEANGRYSLAGSSPTQGIDPKDGTSTNDFELEIRNGSFFVSRSNRWHGCGDRDRLQFRLSAQGWQLIGANTNDGQIEGEGGLMVGRDLNLLTGLEILSVSGHAPIRKKFQRRAYFLDGYPFRREQLFRIPYKGPSPC